MMKIVYWGKGDRGRACLQALLDRKYDVSMVVTDSSQGRPAGTVADLANERNLRLFAPTDPNSPDSELALRKEQADLFVLGGYGKILRANIIDLPRIMTINLHGGKLPEYRGSSPMNWSLINGEKTFGISIIRVDSGVDTGPVLMERQFPVGINDTIRDLHNTANRNFPEMLAQVIESIANGSCIPREQDRSSGAYYPMRFPNDGIIFWDQLTAMDVHNRVRALTTPYPCATTYFNGRKVALISTRLCEPPFYGEPGRIYKQTSRGLLVCAGDKCVWVTEAKFVDNGRPATDEVKRYDKFATVKDLLTRLLERS